MKADACVCGLDFTKKSEADNYIYIFTFIQSIANKKMAKSLLRKVLIISIISGIYARIGIVIVVS